MSDDFIRGLRDDWQATEINADEVLRRLRRNRWAPHFILGAEVVACALAFLVGLWFAWVAAHSAQHRVLFALSAGVLLLTAPALCYASVTARSASLAWDVETTESILSTGIRRAEASLRTIRIGRWHLAIIALFVMTLWTLEATGLVQAIDFLILYTTVCFVVSVPSWMWMTWEEKRASRELAACARLLTTLQVDNEGHPEPPEPN